MRLLGGDEESDRKDYTKRLDPTTRAIQEPCFVLNLNSNMQFLISSCDESVKQVGHHYGTRAYEI